jgi:membrane-associated phospholipid phosphatase
MAAAVVLLAAASTAVGLIITRLLDGSIGDLDLDVARELVDRRTPWADRLTGAATVLADTVTVALLWIGAMAFWAWRTRQWTIPVFLLVAIGGEKLTYLLTSLAVSRDRPSVEPLGHVYATGSFPSGHVGAAITLYGGLVAVLLWRDAPRTWSRPAMVRMSLVVVVVVVALLVGASRLYRGHHYLTDVVWGVVLGLAWLRIARLLVLACEGDPSGDRARRASGTAATSARVRRDGRSP